MTHFLKQSGAWLWPACLLAASIVVALLLHYVLFAMARHFTRRSTGVIGSSLVRHAEGPTRWILPLLAVMLTVPSLPVRSDLVQIVRHAVGLGVIAAVAWVVILLVEVVSDTIYSRSTADASNPFTSRRIRTQTAVLRHTANLIVIIITAGIMLMTFPAIRQVGASLLASAGIAGLVIGIAMKPTFSNLIAGLQIAFTAPIRIDDVVIVDGEWGWIEEILTTYVVVRTWDLRRLVVPLSYFIDHIFQNWTRRTSDLLAYVYIYCDYTTPIEELRQEFRRVLESTPLWDRKVCALQVTDASEQTLQVRALTSASDSSKAWDLRCYVREKLVRFLQERYPHSLPRMRAEVGAGPTDGPSPEQEIALHRPKSGRDSR